jgi:hypothetical protein
VSYFQYEDSVQVRSLAQNNIKIMNLANKTFRNNKTGEFIKVIDSFENIAVLENKQKMDVRTLIDPIQYTEQIDPNSFFNNQNAYNSLAEKIKNIPINNMIDESGVVNINVDDRDNFKPSINESAIIMSSEEDEMAELSRKYGATVDNGDSVSKQQQAFAKLLGEEPVVESQPIVNQVVNQQLNQTINRNTPPVERVEVEDPIITMFRKTKRNVNFNISIDISDKIPRLDFIEMMEDSYEISMIDFLADDFTNKILQDPSIIRDVIKSKIKNLVYGDELIKSNVDQITDSVTTKHEPLSIEKEPVLSKDLPKKTTTRKPRAKKEQPKK